MECTLRVSKIKRFDNDLYVAMSEYRRYKTQNATWFFTVVTWQRRPILCDDPIRNALREAIRNTRTTHPFQIDAWVLLPDHLHCLWTLPENDKDYSIRWAKIKRHVTKACRDYHRNDDLNQSKTRRKEGTIWQRRFWEHMIRDENDYRRHMDYIHWNPIKHGLVSNVNEWPYSSFHKLRNEGVYPENWCAYVDADDNLDFGE